MFELRPYQSAAVDALRASLAQGHRSPCLVAPTGSGKTHIARDLIGSAVAKCKRVLFLAPRRELIYQTVAKLVSAGIPHGVIMAGENVRPWEPVQVACIPTLHARAIRSHRLHLPEADLLIVDEAHLSIARSTVELLQAYPHAVKVGMTATPARTDGRGLGMVYDDLVLGPSVAELTEKGWLVPARYFAPSKPDLAGVKITAGDYNQRQLGARMDDVRLVGDVIANWARICPDRKTVVFAVNVAHSLHLRDRFAAVGVNAEHLDGTTPNEERAEILRRLRSGQTQVLCNCDVLTYGWDEPSIEAAILARPTKSITRYFQMVGRVLRPSDGKSDCIVIDHAGAVDEFGFVDEPVAWALDPRGKIAERKVREAKTVEEHKITCGECATVFPAAKFCPNCGNDCAQRYAKAIECTNAELAELDREKQRKAKAEWTAERKAQFYAELKGYAQTKGYNPHWADHKFRERLQVWPNAFKHVEPATPGLETRSWITSRAIAYAKRKPPAAEQDTSVSAHYLREMDKAIREREEARKREEMRALEASFGRRSAA